MNFRSKLDYPGSLAVEDPLQQKAVLCNKYRDITMQPGRACEVSAALRLFVQQFFTLFHVALDFL
jgi:hypothetical protein